MTDRDELRDRLDDLESRFDTEPVDTFDAEELTELSTEAREILPPERVARLDELEAEMEQNGVHVDDTPDRVGRPPELTPTAKRWLNMIIGETAEYQLEQRGL